MKIAEISIRKIVTLLLCMMIVGNASVEAGTRAGADSYDSNESPEPFEPDIPDEAWLSLVKWQTASVSLQQFYAYTDESKSKRNIDVPDTILVKFGCDSYSFIVGMPFVEMPQNTRIDVFLYRNEKGKDRLYHKFSWTASLNSYGQYTVDEKDFGDTLILFPGNYLIEYVRSDESSDFEIDESEEESVDDSDVVRYRTSVMLPTHSSVNISMECMEVPPGMIPYVPPSPEILTTDMGSRSLWGEYNVTDIGAATYDLTIEMPKHQYTPKVGISYNSQMLGYGLVGYGINITGISVITRSGKNRFYDKDNKGVTYTDDDAFLLDGQRLVSLGDDKYSIAGSPFTIITRYNDNGRTWFSVIDKGMVYEYGKDASSVNCLESGKHCNAIYEWYLCRATDSNGNYAVYNYEKSEMLVYPVKITYGMNDVVASGECSTVEFEYDQLGDNKRSFVVDGVRGYNNKCLKSITTGTSGSVYRKYLFGYDNTSDNSNCKFTRLESVVVQTGNGETSAPIKFQWDELTDDLGPYTLRDEYQHYEPGATESYSYYMASDLNADGISDIIKFSNVVINSGGNVKYVTIIYMLLSEKTYGSNVAFKHIERIVIPSFVTDTSGAIDEMTVVPFDAPSIVDFDGDGYNDLVFTYLPAPKSHYLIIWGKDIVENKTPRYDAVIVPVQSASLCTIADFNGDGRDEIVYVDTKNNDNNYTAGIIMAHPATSGYENCYTFTLPSEPKEMFSADFNSDGLMDIIIMLNNCCVIYYNNGGVDKAGLFSDTNKLVCNQLGSRIRMSQGDFNGDGLLDFVFYDRPTRSLKIAVNEGNGNFTFSYSDKIDFDLSVSNNCTMMVCDIDRDGMSDVMIANNYSNRIKTQFLYSDGARLRLKRTYDVANNSSGNRVGLSVFMGDFDGDGAEEVANVGVMLTFDGSMSRNMIYSYRPQGKAYEKSRVINITDWLGKGVRFRYSSLSSPSVYSKDASSYPVNSYSIPLSVVSRMEERNCGYASATTYCYNTLRYHVAGRGLIGFNSVTKANDVTDIKQIMKVSSWDNLWYIPLVIQNTSIVGGDSVTTVITNNVHDINRKNYFSYPLTEETVDMYGNKSRTSYDYDVTTGLLQSQKTIFDDDEGMFKSVSYSDYTCLENKWLPRTIINTWKYSDDNDVFTGKTTLVYDSNGNTISKTVNDGTTLALTSTNTYDSRGNILSTVNAGSGVVPVTKHFEYDDNGRFMTCTYSSPATAVKRYVYDKWGNILAEIDETDPDNKLIHSMSYDGWGKKTSDTAPDGTGTSYEYGWGETDEFRSYVVSKKGDVTFETRWYDCLGRERLVKSPTGIGDVETATRTYYDKCGKVCRIESFNGCLVLNKTYAYDKKGRVIEMKNAGRTETYEYGNRECITTVNGKTYKNVTDAWGNLIYAEDPLSSVEYRYYSNGKPSSITTDGCSVEVKYDAAGNKIQLTDPDAGTSTFSYSADGILLSQTDARGVNANYEFDNTGRTLKVTTGDYTVTNTYGTGGYALQRIQRRSDGNNHIDYTYDEYGRVVKESRTVYGQGVFDYEFFYDSNGRVSKSIYPGGLEVTYEYDWYGNIILTRANGITVRSFMDNDGKTIKYMALGKYVYTDKVDDNGYLMEISCAEDLDDEQSATERIVKLEYDASTGNLVSRHVGSGNPHTYVYDNLDRLTNVSVGGEEMLSVIYADNGNILNKSDVGDYEYMSSRPHAVTEIGNPLNSVPSATQLVRYNDIGKVSAIEQDLLSMTFDYGPDSQRWHSVLTEGTDTLRETVYVGNYERVEEKGIMREFYYLDGNIVIVRHDGVFTPYIAFADEQGSILTLFDSDDVSVFEASYDEWGCQDVTLNTIGLQRGYTGHEMMPEFGVINMNGRMYDPLLARFFSPDNFVQEPVNSQSFNRYTYCLNNPLRYTDPSGEWFGVDDLIVAAVGAVVGYVSSGIKTGNWGMKSIKAGICSAAASYLGYNSIGLLSGRSSLTNYLTSMGVSSVSNLVIPTMSIPLSSSVSYSASPMFGLGEGGLLCGVSLGFGFNFGDDWNMTVSGGVSNQYAAANISATCKGWGAGYGYTQHFNQPIAQNTTLGRQGVGTISLQLQDVSLRFSNDAVGDRRDRWRSNAVEIGINDFVFGTYITTGDGKGESTVGEDPMVYFNNDVNKEKMRPIKEIDGKDKGTTQWIVGNVYSAPFWIGYKSGNQVYRIGYSHKQIQDKTQNLVHKTIVPTPLFVGEEQFKEGVYIYSGYNSPYSLW